MSDGWSLMTAVKPFHGSFDYTVEDGLFQRVVVDSPREEATFSVPRCRRRVELSSDTARHSRVNTPDNAVPLALVVGGVTLVVRYQARGAAIGDARVETVNVSVRSRRKAPEYIGHHARLVRLRCGAFVELPNVREVQHALRSRTGRS